MFWLLYIKDFTNAHNAVFLFLINLNTECIKILYYFSKDDKIRLISIEFSSKKIQI